MIDLARYTIINVHNIQRPTLSGWYRLVGFNDTHRWLIPLKDTITQENEHWQIAAEYRAACGFVNLTYEVLAIDPSGRLCISCLQAIDNGTALYGHPGDGDPDTLDDLHFDQRDDD